MLVAFISTSKLSNNSCWEGLPTQKQNIIAATTHTWSLEDLKQKQKKQFMNLLRPLHFHPPDLCTWPVRLDFFKMIRVKLVCKSWVWSDMGPWISWDFWYEVTKPIIWVEITSNPDSHWHSFMATGTLHCARCFQSNLCVNIQSFWSCCFFCYTSFMWRGHTHFHPVSGFMMEL